MSTTESKLREAVKALLIYARAYEGAFHSETMRKQTVADIDLGEAALALPASSGAEPHPDTKDAERYRWLRDSDWQMFEDGWLTESDLYGQGPDDLDAAIDTALAQAEAAKGVAS